MTTSLLIFVVIAAAMVLSLLVVSSNSVQAQQNQNQTVQKKTIAGLNNNTASEAVHSQFRLLNIAKLHNATSTKINGLTAAGVVLNCVNVALAMDNTITKTNFWYSVGQRILNTCDDGITFGVTNHTSSYLYGEGSNQTIIHIAKEYLKSRGIQ